MAAVALALAGALLLWIPGYRFRIDAVQCDRWPAVPTWLLCSLALLVALALLALAWRRASRAGWPLGRTLLLGALVHLTALGAPPFASNDPLFYAATGHAMAAFGASPRAPLSTVLPADDPYLLALPPEWHDGVGVYGEAFNQLTRLLATLAGPRVSLLLRLLQLCNLVALLGAAALTGLTFGAPAAALLLFCPLALLDGTVAAHNDAYIALLVAAFAWLTRRGQRLLALLPLLFALAIKMSAAILLLVELGALFGKRIATRLSPRRLVLVASLAAALGIVVLLVALRRFPGLGVFTALFGDPSESSPHFTRSFEALPRALFTFVLHRPLWSWLLGLLFRAAAFVWLLYCAAMAARLGAPLTYGAVALFGNYLFLYGYLQSWYLLPLLPLLPALPGWMRPACERFLLCLSAYYVIDVPLGCSHSVAAAGLKELVEALLVLLPAALTLRASYGRRASASAESAPPAV